MSTSHLLFEPAGGVHYPLNSRASSATLFLSQRIPLSHIDGATDPVDISIAQGLLQKGKYPNVQIIVTKTLTSNQRAHKSPNEEVHLTIQQLLNNRVSP